MSKRVGLMVGRFQPLHDGHCKIINKMIQDCETAIVCLGSAQKSRELHDPWTVEERMQMIKNVYGAYNNKGEYVGCRVKIVPLNDLGAANPEQWTDYIFEKLAKLGLPEPMDYYTGSYQDSLWYNKRFSVDWGDDNTTKHLHILDRTLGLTTSATEIRGFLSLRSLEWKKYIPAVNHSLVESTYPEEFKVPLNEQS